MPPSLAQSSSSPPSPSAVPSPAAVPSPPSLPSFAGLPPARWWGLSFRARLVIVVAGFTLVTLGAGFWVIAVAVQSSQEGHLDQALLHAARDQAAELSRRSGDDFTLNERPGPLGNQHIGPLTKFAAVYDSAGRVRQATPSFREGAPRLEAGHTTADRCFDLWFDGEHLRAAVVEVADRQGARLLLAVPRTELDGDVVFLRHAMQWVFGVAVAWTIVVASWIAHQLTRAQRRIAQVVREVTAGNLTARVGTTTAVGDELQLARDVDQMIERLSDLLNSQRVFIAHAAHELRSPLTVVYGELSLALRRSRDVDQYRQAIADGLEATRRLKVLTEDLLAVARLGVSPPTVSEPVDVRAALDEAIRVVSVDDNRETIRLDIAGHCRAVLAAPGDLTRLLRNLIENAVRHSPRGSTVRARLEDGPETVTVTVSDEGAGVPAGERGKIFQAFYRGTDVPSVGGAEVGLGLTIARGLARAHGGDIVLEETSAQGAHFRVTLPAAGADSRRAGTDTHE